MTDDAFEISPSARRVFVVNAGFHDYSSAESRGKLVAVTSGNVNVFATDRIEAQIQEVLKTSHSSDWLLLSGSPVLVALAVGYMYRLHGQVNCLIWDTSIRDYVPRTLTFEDREVGV